MIPLESPRWNELRDAYGPATQIPNLLRELQSDPRPKASSTDEPWFSLWSALCHQGDIYPASYAAVPHIVSTLRNLNPPVAMGFFLLPVCIELARVGEHGPSVPDELARDYHNAVKELAALADKFAATTDPYLRRSIDAAKLVGEGNYSQATALIDPD